VDLQKMVLAQAQQAKEVSRILAALSSTDKDQALKNMAGALERGERQILAANQKDIEAGRKIWLRGFVKLPANRTLSVQ